MFSWDEWFTAIPTIMENSPEATLRPQQLFGQFETAPDLAHHLAEKGFFLFAQHFRPGAKLAGIAASRAKFQIDSPHPAQFPHALVAVVPPAKTALPDGVALRVV